MTMEETFKELLDDDNTKAAGIAMISATFMAKDAVLTQRILEEGFEGFCHYL